MTLAIGFLLPSNHHVLHCRCQTYYVGCLLIGDLLLAMNQITGSLITGIPCSIIGKRNYFQLLLTQVFSFFHWKTNKLSFKLT